MAIYEMMSGELDEDESYVRFEAPEVKRMGPYEAMTGAPPTGGNESAPATDETLLAL